jgi:hypothetical protein
MFERGRHPFNLFCFETSSRSLTPPLYHHVPEHSLQTGYGDVLALLWWKSEGMLIDIEEYEEKRANRRSDRRRWEV